MAGIFLPRSIAQFLVGLATVAWFVVSAPAQENPGGQSSESQQEDKVRRLDWMLDKLGPAIRRNPTNAMLFYYRGTIELEKHEIDAAISDFNESIRLDQRNAKALAWRGFAKFKKNDVDAALVDIEQALKLDNQNLIALETRASIRRQKKDNLGALIDLSEAIRIDGTNAALYVNHGSVLIAENNLEGAMEDYNRAIELNPKDAYAFIGRAQVIIRTKGDLDGALADENRAIELAPKNSVARKERGNTEMALGNLRLAITDYDEAIKLDPKSAACLYYRGICRGLLHEPGQSVEDLKQSVRLDYEFPDYAHFQIWLIRSMNGEGANADKELSEYLSKRKGDAKDDWEGVIGSFLLGRVTEKDFQSAAVSPDPLKDAGRKCEADYYMGMKHLIAGDKENATRLFRESVAAKSNEYVEYWLAQYELKVLGK